MERMEERNTQEREALSAIRDGGGQVPLPRERTSDSNDEHDQWWRESQDAERPADMAEFQLGPGESATEQQPQQRHLEEQPEPLDHRNRPQEPPVRERQPLEPDAEENERRDQGYPYDPDAAAPMEEDEVPPGGEGMEREPSSGDGGRPSDQGPAGEENRRGDPHTGPGGQEEPEWAPRGESPGPRGPTRSGSSPPTTNKHLPRLGGPTWV